MRRVSIIVGVLSVVVFSVCVEANASQDLTASDQCCYCPLGSFLVPSADCAASHGDTNCCCEYCPFLSTTQYAGATSVNNCTCIPGTYGDLEIGCQPCPIGAICDGSRYPTPTFGYLISPVNREIIIRCYPEDSCDPSTETGCGAGYVGPYCSECAEGYSFTFDECHKCSGFQPWRVFIPLMMVSYVIISFYFQQFREQNESTSPYTPLLILVHHLQVIATFPNIHFFWPQPVMNLFYGLSSLNINVQLLDVECSGEYFKDPIDIWLLQVSLPLMIIALYVIIFICYEISLYIKRTSYMEGVWKVQMKYTLGKLITAAFRCLTLTYLMVCMATLSIFSCQEESDGVVHPRYQSSETCYSSSWFRHNFAYGFVGLIVFIFGIPLLNVYFVHKQRKDPENRLFAFLVSRYDKHLHYWEIIVLTFRLLRSMLAQFSSHMTGLQTVLVTGLFFLELYLTAYFRPHTNKRNDHLAIFTKACVLSLVVSGALFYYSSYDDGYSDSTESFFVAVVYTHFALIVAAYLWTLYKAMKEKKEMNENRYKYYEELCRQIFNQEYRDLSLRWFSQCTEQQKIEFAEAAEGILRIQQVQSSDRSYLNHGTDLDQRERAGTNPESYREEASLLPDAAGPHGRVAFALNALQ